MGPAPTMRMERGRESGDACIFKGYSVTPQERSNTSDATAVEMRNETLIEAFYCNQD